MLVLRFSDGLVFLLLTLIPASLLAADIEGEVRTGLRAGLQHVATVQLLDGSRVVKETYTDLDGRFDFTEIPARLYRIRVKYAGFADGEIVVTPVAGAATTRVSITLKPAETSSGVSHEVVAADELNVPKAAAREFEKGLELRKKGDCEKALPHLLKAVSVYDRYGSAFNELGQCARQKGRLAEAETYLRKAVQHSSSFTTSVNLANLYLGSGRLGDAQQVIEAAIRAHPTEGDLFFALARIRFEQGKVREAETAGLEAHSRNHATADVHLLLARMYLEGKNYPALITQLETYLIENPTGAAAAQVRASLSEIQSQTQKVQ